MRNTEILAQLL